MPLAFKLHGEGTQLLQDFAGGLGGCISHMKDKRNRRMHALDRLDGGRYILRDELLHAGATKCFDQREQGTPISIADYETDASCVEIQELARHFEAHSLESRELQEIRCLGKYSPKHLS